MVVIRLWNLPSLSERRNVCVKSDQIKGLSPWSLGQIIFHLVQLNKYWPSSVRFDPSSVLCEFILCLKKKEHFELMVLPL